MHSYSMTSSIVCQQMMTSYKYIVILHWFWNFWIFLWKSSSKWIFFSVCWSWWFTHSRFPLQPIWFSGTWNQWGNQSFCCCQRCRIRQRIWFLCQNRRQWQKCSSTLGLLEEETRWNIDWCHQMEFFQICHWQGRTTGSKIQSYGWSNSQSGRSNQKVTLKWLKLA